MPEVQDGLCLICGQTLSASSYTLVQRGLDAIRIAAEKRKDRAVLVQLNNLNEVTLHEKCRKNYTRASTIASYCKSLELEENVAGNGDILLRNQVDDFNFKENCLFCGGKIVETKRKDSNRDVFPVRTLEFTESILSRAREIDDECSRIVSSRVMSVVDLVAAEARYHQKCNLSFKKSSVCKRGRPADVQKETLMTKLCNFIQNSEDSQYSLKELITIMKTFGAGFDAKVYTDKYLKEKLKGFFGSNLVIIDRAGKSPIVCLKSFSDKVINAQWYQDRKTNEDEERKRIVEAASKIVLEDIRAFMYPTEFYPTSNDIANSKEMVPETLNLFLRGLIEKYKKKPEEYDAKIQYIEHMIINSVRPRSFYSPLIFSLSLHLHRKYGARYLIELLSAIGVATPYSQIGKFLSVAVLDPVAKDISANFVQFIYDNADFNTNTLDGYNTFHAMGGVVSVTPVVNTPDVKVPISAISKEVQKGKFPSIPVMHYSKRPSMGLKNVKVLNFIEASNQCLVGFEEFKYWHHHDCMWLLNKILIPSEINDSDKTTGIPSWSGYMTLSTKNFTEFSTSSVIALPFINLDPSNLTTLYSALQFAKSESKRYKMESTIVTFDQPLFYKACDIKYASDDLNDLIIRLGGFHTLMSFLGSIGDIMAGSGLEEVISCVYAPNSVRNIMNGHAYSRAVRAHFLVGECLMKLIIQKLKPLDDACTKELKQICQISETESVFSVDLAHSDVGRLTLDISKIVDELKTSSRTAKLWCQYLDQVQIIRMFIRAERTGNWPLHMACIEKMLPFFHASGHLNYAKSAHLYLQEMLELPRKMSDGEFKSFSQKGFFAIRRSNKFWSGLWSDLTIEQVLMRSMKSSGGLTHGRGITESTLAKWISSIPVTLPYSIELEEFCGTKSEFSEQHVELRNSRISRDSADCMKISEWFAHHPPFSNEGNNESIVSLSSGLTGDETINCEKAEEVGRELLKKVDGQSFSELKLQRSSKVKSLASLTNSINIKGENITVNTTQLFNRIICCTKTDEELQECFKYELANHPTALFDPTGFKKCKKSALLDVLPKPTDVAIGDLSPSSTHFVIDGGFLLHKVVWPRGSTYEEVFKRYFDYLQRTFHGSKTVIFDGYPSTGTTKTQEQERRIGKRKQCVDVNFQDDMKVYGSQGDFLSNRHNKVLFIKRLSSYLIKRGIQTETAEDDADAMIVNTGLQYSDANDVVIVGEDTDLIVLFISLGDQRAKQLYFYIPDSCKKSGKLYLRSKVLAEVGKIKDILMPFHALTGCDTNSALFKQGKKKPYSALKVTPGGDEIQSYLKPFLDFTSSHEMIAAAGEKFLIALYAGRKRKSYDTLDELRFFLFHQATARSPLMTNFDLALLPPTSNASQYHSYRAFLQVCKWRGVNLPQEEWGWQRTANGFMPKKASIAPAPDFILSLIYCGCEAGCRKNCTCVKSTLPCSSMCVGCRGICCDNSVKIDDEDELL
ncbi:unnamed protein product [Bemisia tabaci]|uniref:Tesmin/TSO1-like CXC domain-containing protein n=1 Tax=Bemisia tabaci TaxID=7038 RepID=A0AAI8Y621_BEMTA|nr:unnamed protein product [Bemisia tabaci]